MRVAILAVFLVVAVAAQEPQQPPVPKFRSGVDVVVLDVAVLDRDRRPVRGLAAADFTVLEDGKPQPIVSFEELSAPDPDGSLVPWMREVAPDVRTNADDNRRVITMILDDANVNFRLSETVRKIARTVVDQLGPSDQLCIIYTGVNQKSQEFTSDRRQLRRAVERYADALVGGSGGQYAIQTIRRASETLLALPHRRKAMIFISTLAVDFADPVDDLGLQLRKAMEAAQEANIAIFPVNPAGLEVDIDTPAAPRMGIMPASPGSRRDLVNDTARFIAQETGGFAIVNSNAFDDQMKQVFRETGAYYLIGFQSAHTDGKLRRIEVRANRPGLTVRTRTGYRAPKPEPERKKARADTLPIMKSVSGILPSPDVPVRVSLAPFAIPGRDLATVTIVIGVQQPAPAGGNKVVENVQVMTSAFDTSTQAYRARGVFMQKVQLTLRPVDEGGDAKYEVLSKIDLRPGRYQLRFGVHSERLKKTGSVYQELDIPDYRKQPLSLSGIVLGTDPALPSAPRDYLSQVVPIAPTTQRSFAPTDRATAYLRIYQGGKKPPISTVLTATVVDSDDRRVHATTEHLSTEQFDSDRAYAVRLNLPLERLQPGPHLLRIEAAADKHQQTRDVRFFVRQR